MEARQQAHLAGIARPAEVDGVVADDARARPRRHDHHAVRQRDRLLQVVGDEQHRLAVAGPQLEQQVAHDLPRLGIERTERLVHQQHLGIADQHLGEADALPLPARELVRIAVAERRQPHALQPRLRALQRLGPRHAGDLQADGDVVARRLPRHHRVLLEEVAGMPVEARQRRPEHEGLAGGRRQQPGRHVEQGGLAAAGRADDGNELVRADLQVRPGDRRIAGPAGHRKIDGDAVEADGGRACVLRSDIALGMPIAQRTLSLIEPRLRARVFEASLGARRPCQSRAGPASPAEPDANCLR